MSGAKVNSLAKPYSIASMPIYGTILTVTTATFTAELVDDVARFRNDSYERAKLGSRTHSQSVRLSTGGSLKPRSPER